MTFAGSGLIIEPLEAIDAMKSMRAERKKEFGIVHAVVHVEKGFKL
jgi:hypothetical protein